MIKIIIKFKPKENKMKANFIACASGIETLHSGLQQEDEKP